ncbi:hypothetical protein L195_g041210, partial [Trifolium pratense]
MLLPRYVICCGEFVAVAFRREFDCYYDMWSVYRVAPCAMRVVKMIIMHFLHVQRLLVAGQLPGRPKCCRPSSHTDLEPMQNRNEEVWKNSKLLPVQVGHNTLLMWQQWFDITLVQARNQQAPRVHNNTRW